MKKQLKSVILLTILALIYCIPIVSSSSLFLIGEDVVGPGILLSVNNMTREHSTGGLGGMSKTDDITMNLTLVNTGMKTFRIDPTKDFTIELSHMHKAVYDKSGKSTKGAFNLFPNAQSRVDLFFQVPSSETVAPILIFSVDGDKVEILCDSRLQKLAEKSKSTGLTTDETVDLAKFYLDAGRYLKADSIVEPALLRDAFNFKLLVQMASIEDLKGNPRQANLYLGRINMASVNKFEDAIELAQQSYKLGFYTLSIDVLEPYQLTNRLNDEHLVLLGRSHYYNKDYEKAKDTIKSALKNGSSSKLAYFTMGNIYNKTKELDAAIEMWEKAIGVDPEYCEAYYNLGVGYFKKDNIEKAREYWSKVPLLNPDSQTLEAVEEALKATEN